MPRDFQAAFARALAAPNDPLPEDLFVSAPVPADIGFGVYRQNIHAKLIAALNDLYPVVARLVGGKFFRHAAIAYIRRHPARTPVLLKYGDGFPEFLAGFPDAASLPYLADVARLELARHQAYHAPDAMPLTVEEFKTIPPERLPELRLTLHPSRRLICSPYPIDAIWEANRPDKTLVEPVMLPDRGARLLIYRPRERVIVAALTDAEFRFLTALDDGATVTDAMAAADHALELSRPLAILIADGAFTAWQR